MRRHIEKTHTGVTFEEFHLDFQCRICMEPEQNEDMTELMEHIRSKHGSGGGAGDDLKGESAKVSAVGFLNFMIVYSLTKLPQNTGEMYNF
jgi:hypothetical protein